MRVSRLRDEMIDSALGISAAGVVVAVLMATVFDHEAGGVIGGGILGAVLLGGVYFWLDVRERLPRGEIAELPFGTPVDPVLKTGWARRLLLFAALSLLLFAAAVLAEAFDAGVHVILGPLFGAAVAEVAGAILVDRWERDRGTQVFVDEGDDEDEQGEKTLYVADAGPSLAPIT